MITVTLTRDEMQFIRIRMQAIAMNAIGNDAAMAERILDSLALAVAEAPREHSGIR